MPVWITGDCHGDFNKFARKQREKLDIKPDDFVIICGDVGLLWADDKTLQYNLDFFKTVPFTILWIGGNHDNYNMIEQYPLSDWHGGKVRQIIPNKVIYLERGQVYNIEGKTYFTMGGASSHDISDGILDRNSSDFKTKLKTLKRLKKSRYRILNESWWKQELPSEKEIETALLKLQEVGDKVDYIITHCCSSEIEELLGLKNHDRLTDFFNYIERFVEFNHWYFGHYHQDCTMYDNKHTITYHRFVRIDSNEA